MVAAVLFNLHHVNVLLLTAKMILAKLIVDTLCDIIDTPIHAVKKEVGIDRVDTRAANAALHPSYPDVTGVLRLLAVALAPMLPGIAEVAAQHQLVELRRLVFAIERISQRLRTILLLKYQTEGVLGILLCQTTVSSVETDAAGGAQVVLLRTAKEFHTGRARPTVPRGVTHRRSREDIDAATVGVVLMAEEVILVRDDAQDGQLFQALDNLRSQRRVTRHLLIHLVVGNGSFPSVHIGIEPPLCRVACRIIGLTQHRVDEDVGSRAHGRQRIANLLNGT